jgi:hypothetical protein
MRVSLTAEADGPGVSAGGRTESWEVRTGRANVASSSA